MTTTSRAPKQWQLTEDETILSFEKWRQNMLYSLKQDPEFKAFLVPGFHWEKSSVANRGFTDDNTSVPATRRKTAGEKCELLELFLGQIANYVPVLHRDNIVDLSSSLNQIWQTIRSYYGFQTTGAHYLDLALFKAKVDERHETLYQRMYSFVRDNMLKASGGITHHGEEVTRDETLTPIMENTLVVLWLWIIHPDLPQHVKQRYATELRTRTIASIRPEVSSAIKSLLDDLNGRSDEVRAMPLSNNDRFGRSQRSRPRENRQQRSRPANSGPTCPLCQQTGRQPINHYMSTCPFLPEREKRFIIRNRRMDMSECELEDGDLYDLPEEEPEPEVPQDPSLSRVAVVRSPSFRAFAGRTPTTILIDSGAESNFIHSREAHRLGLPVRPNATQRPSQADGKSTLRVNGETRVTFNRKGQSFFMDALVTPDLSAPIIAGTTFMKDNDISIRPKFARITFADGSFYTYDDTKRSPHSDFRLLTTDVIRHPGRVTIWPGETITCTVPDAFADKDDLLIGPRADSVINKSGDHYMWPPPQSVSSVSNQIIITNDTSSPVAIPKTTHLCNISLSTIAEVPDISDAPSAPATDDPKPRPRSPGTTWFSDACRIDPDNQMEPQDRDRFRALLREYDTVFGDDLPGYNGKAGRFEATINMGKVLPPQRKGRVPQYGRDNLDLLQSKCDDLTDRNVLATPQDADVEVENVSPTFLVRKSDGTHRMVTAFNDIGRYTRPTPSLLPDVQNTIRQVGGWRYISLTDLAKAFFQIPLARESQRFCGICTPFKGIRVYQRCAMGMPGSETALEELMSKVVGHLIQTGAIVKIADDLFIGGDSIDDMYNNWKALLSALHRCDLRLSPSKTVICPQSATLLGWTWRNGTLTASTHILNTLSTCSRPATITSLRSFIGSYKTLAKVLPHCASYTAPLDDLTAQAKGSDVIQWTDETTRAFNAAQEAVKSSRTVHIPKPSDTLWMTTDAAARPQGIGAILYCQDASQKSKIKVGGYFSAKLRKHQTGWLPCELEALAISSTIRHYAPYIIQSAHKATILTDSKPCVQAVEKMYRGEFSASPRLTSLLATVSQYQVLVRHVSGVTNLPADFQSRNPLICDAEKCQVCAFIQQDVESPVLRFTPIDLPPEPLLFTNRQAWIKAQATCPDVRRAKAHLLQGTRPSRKVTNARDTKKYIAVCTIARDGLLVVKTDGPFQANKEAVVIPRHLAPGIATAIHLQNNHPTASQLTSAMKRQFYAIALESICTDVTENCHQCTALKATRSVQTPQATSEPLSHVGAEISLDVLKSNRQLILVAREPISAYTCTSLIEAETADALRSAIIAQVLPMRTVSGPPTRIRTDPAPAFLSLQEDRHLRELNLVIEVGRIKNLNKNPVAEKAIGELRSEIRRIQPEGGPISPARLAIATDALNRRVRSCGLSAREVWTQRNQHTGDQIPFKDQDLIDAKHRDRLYNHEKSQLAKGGKPPNSAPRVGPGSLVYLRCDRDKTASRPRYIVTESDNNWCHVQKIDGSAFRSRVYKVRPDECFTVPSDFHPDVPTVPDATEPEREPPDRHGTDPASGPDSAPPMMEDLPPGEPTPQVILTDIGPDDCHAPDPRDIPPESTRRPARQRREPSWLKDYVRRLIYAEFYSD